jgi:adenylate kinase
MANKIVFVCGSPGAGKSSIINGIAQDSNYKLVNVGTLMMQTELAKKYVKNRDEIRFLSKAKINELQIETFKEISKMEGNIVLDTHATLEQNGRYIPGITIGHREHLNKLVGFIYIDALTQDISRRRKDDHSRRREHERLELIDVQRLVNVSILSTCATMMDLPLYVVFNEQGELDQTIKGFKDHLKDVFGV